MSPGINNNLSRNQRRHMHRVEPSTWLRTEINSVTFLRTSVGNILDIPLTFLEVPGRAKPSTTALGPNVSGKLLSVVLFCQRN